MDECQKRLRYRTISRRSKSRHIWGTSYGTRCSCFNPLLCDSNGAMAHTPGELTTTLILALSQSREQVRTLQSQAARIQQLGTENEKLKRELEELNKTREEPDTFQVDDLFQQNAECRAEILRLKQKLKKYKDKATGRLGVPISSPISAATTPGSTRHLRTFPEPEPPTADLEPPSVKRQRLDQSFKDVSSGTGHSRRSSTSASKKSVIEKKIAAIPLLTEDGEDHVVNTADVRPPDKQTLGREGSLYKRLDGLLAAPSPGRAPLGRSKEPERSIQTPDVGIQGATRKYNISNMNHVPHGAKSPGKSGDRNPTTPLQETSKMRSNTRSREKLQPRNPARSSRNAIALRDRPIDQLRLSDFKPNPRWLDSHGMSYDEFLYGQNKARIEELAKTLPSMPGQNLTDDELLVEMLGPGRESEIAKMASMARTNLLNEAKLRRVASAFGKQRVDYDRENEPPGFWNIDMPGTQEEEGNRRIAIERDRAEVKRRYDDAMSGQGRFVFADENAE